MVRLILASNRLPLTATRREGKIRLRQSVGGLATGLESFCRSYDHLWIGWSGLADKGIEGELESQLFDQYHCLPVALSKTDIDNYYNGFCNKTIWPLFNYFPQYMLNREIFWSAYQRVNNLFAEKIVKATTQHDVIWVHDYHLMLLPSLLRRRLPDLKIGVFLHIPFPSFELFRLLPQRSEVLEGLLGADLIGFHTYDYACHFLESVRRILGCENTLGRIRLVDREAKVDAFPMGIDYERFQNAAADPRVRKEVDQFRKRVGDKKVILSMDRLDYTKGIPQRLQVFDLFLERNPEYAGKIKLVLATTPSREDVDRYTLLKREVDQLVGEINGKHGTVEWTPILYISRFLPFRTLISLYNLADVMMVTPLRDGMNLMAKEYVATRTDGMGVLILSEMAGAARELGEAIIVNPNDREALVNALKEALILPDEKKTRRIREMQTRLRRYNVERWAEDFLDSIQNPKHPESSLICNILRGEEEARLISDYHAASHRLILLDYDGTLVGFVEDPANAKPDNELLQLLREISETACTEVVIISGRSREALDQWFASLRLGLVAEHGAWTRTADTAWESIDDLRTDWKAEIRPIMELHADRTPGSFVEEKTFSLVWHYRRVDPDLGIVRARELRANLSHLTADTDLQVLEGNKIVEIKNVGVDKGRAALKWLSKTNPSFILAAGDDSTDEDLFTALPDHAYTLKVGMGTTSARNRVMSHLGVRSLLRELAGQEQNARFAEQGHQAIAKTDVV